jgi:energy-coupling factor transport system ATP-binding protein
VALVAHNLSFSYGGARGAAAVVVTTVTDIGTPAVALFRDFNAVFERATVTAVTGPNGCGKTTLAKLLTGMLRPTAGEVLIDAKDIASKSLTGIGRHIGLVMQNPERQMFCTSVREEVDFGLRNFGYSQEQIEERRNRYLELFDLAGYEERFPFELSGGEKQRVMLAAVLATGPSYLVLDEPTSALDRGRRQVLGDLLTTLKREEHVGVVLISHDDAFIARFADECIEMGRP